MWFWPVILTQRAIYSISFTSDNRRKWRIAGHPKKKFGSRKSGFLCEFRGDDGGFADCCGGSAIIAIFLKDGSSRELWSDWVISGWSEEKPRGYSLWKKTCVRTEKVVFLFPMRHHGRHRRTCEIRSSGISFSRQTRNYSVSGCFREWRWSWTIHSLRIFRCPKVGTILNWASLIWSDQNRHLIATLGLVDLKIVFSACRADHVCEVPYYWDAESIVAPGRWSWRRAHNDFDGRYGARQWRKTVYILWY